MILQFPTPRPPVAGDDRAAMVARAEQIVEVLGTCFVREGWHEAFDHKRAARFVENVRMFDEHDGDDPRFRQLLAWMRDHGQSLDWLFDGDVEPLICRAAKTPRTIA